MMEVDDKGSVHPEGHLRRAFCRSNAAAVSTAVNALRGRKKVAWQDSKSVVVEALTLACGLQIAMDKRLLGVLFARLGSNNSLPESQSS